MHTLYLGPSWAVQSFESPLGLDDPVKTNLASELKLTSFTSLAQRAASNFDQIECAENFMLQHPELSPFRIVFVTSNSLQDGHKLTGTNQVEFVKSFLKSKNPLGIIQSLEEYFYKKLNYLKIPVALIGAHTDVSCESHDNITVIHNSWQNFLAQQCNIGSFYGWPAEVAHRWFQGIIDSKQQFSPDYNPSKEVVNEIHKLIQKNWPILERNKLFVDCHPNILGNQLFAQQIQKTINNWLDKTS